MEKEKTSNKESFQKIQKYKTIIAGLSVVSTLLAVTSLNLYSQLQDLPPRFADVEGISTDAPFAQDGEFVPGSRMGGGTKIITDRFSPVLEQLVESEDISQDQLELILESLESYDPFN